MRKDERRRNVGPDYFLASSASLMQKRHFRWSGRHSEDSLTDSVFSPHQHLPVWLQSLKAAWLRMLFQRCYMAGFYGNSPSLLLLIAAVSLLL